MDEAMIPQIKRVKKEKKQNIIEDNSSTTEEN